MAGPDLSGYVEVNERIAAFHERYPEGSLQGTHELLELGERTFVVYRAKAYRTPDDQRPGIGTAWEPFPGKTSFTRDSELMNAETSAWGRALAALGFEVKRAIASKEEVEARQNGDQAPATPRADSQLDPERVESIINGFKMLGLNYGKIDLLFGSVGIDGLRAHSPKAIKERLGSLSDEQAQTLENAMAQEADLAA